MAKIKLVIDPERDGAFDREGLLGVKLVAELTDGRSEESVVHQPKGHPQSPLSDAELLEKMTWLMPTETAALRPRRLLDLCQHLATAEDITDLVEICRVEES
jgi:2-methylcitrate dehydratase PrpD